MNLESIMLRLANAIEHNNRLLSLQTPQFMTLDQCQDRWKLSRKQVMLLFERAKVEIILTGCVKRIHVSDVTRCDALLLGSNVIDEAPRMARRNPVEVAGHLALAGHPKGRS